MAQYKKVGNLKVRTDLSPEKQALVNQIAKNYVQQNKKIDAERIGNIARGGFGAAVSGLSFHPILNVPYVGTGVGGAMYDLGQGIVEGQKAKDLWKRAGRGFAIGETVGAVPYVGKFAGKTKAGQAVVKKLDKVGEKVAQNPAVQKAYDTLMTDIRAFNPNKQTVYHGSPYDFEKFSNEAIGTGEGAQAHGYGHYTALDKDVAEGYRKKLSESLHNEKIQSSLWSDLKNDRIPQLNDNEEKELFEYIANNITPSEFNAEHLKNYFFKDLETPEAKEFAKNLLENMAENNNIKTGQLYKLSIPKDDVMLREGASFENQPELVQKGLNNIKKNYLKSKGYNSIDDINAELDSLSNQYENIVKNESPYNFNAGIEKSEIQAKISQLENLRRFNETPDLYNYLLNHQHLEPHEVSDLLYKQGIKGISYNGGIDGEARVIFNPDDIDIVRKFYNQEQAIDHLNKMKPNTGAVADAFNDMISKAEKKQWKQYAKDNLIGNSVDVPNYTTVNFTNKNLGEDYVYNMPEYKNLLDNLKNSQYQFSTNYKNEADRLYDHLTKEDKDRLFDYLIEVIQEPNGNIHHNYKMMKNITRGDLP